MQKTGADAVLSRIVRGTTNDFVMVFAFLLLLCAFFLFLLVFLP